MTDSRHEPAPLLVSLGPAVPHPVSLVCVPHAGAGVTAFHSWRALGRFAALWAVRFPGRESRLAEPPLTTIDEMAEVLAPAVSKVAAHSVVLFGHCSGALVAYEVANRLAELRLGASDLRLVLSSQPAPFARPAPASEIAGQISQAELARRLRALGGTPEAILENPRLMALMEPAIRADLLAAEQYRPPAREALPYDITVLGATSDRAISADSLRAWRDHTTGSFQIKWFEGQHFFVTKGGTAVVEYLAELLRSMR
jgi:surfactin synthase thioesterase subunit